MAEDDTGPAEQRAAIAAMIAEFGSVFRELRCAGSERLVKFGVSMTHLHVIALLSRHGPMPMSRLADLLDVSLSNATGLVDRMEERGFVSRVRVPDDRRLVLVESTELGRQLETEMEFLKGELLDKVLARLDPDQIARVALAIRDLGNAVTAVLAADATPAWHWQEHAHTHRGAADPVPHDEPAVTAEVGATATAR
jgi:DNA-binding MarR family transcriptional regulator